MPQLTFLSGPEIGRALEHAARQNIVHRDIKPDNILVAKDGTAKLDNLWLAKHVAGTAFEEQLTGSGKTLGSLAYMPPEQIGGTRRVDCRADIYALAASIYEAMAGEPPCKGATLEETVRNIREVKPRSLREFNPKIPPAVTLPILRALSKNPNDRQQTARDLVRELELARKFQVR